MLSVQITIKGDRETRAKLKRLGGSLYDFSDAMRNIGTRAAAYYANEGFGSQGGVFGKPWAPLAPSTVRSKLKRYPAFVNVPLVASQHMKEGFIIASGRNQVEVTNSAPYFKYHQSSAARRKLPRRQMIGINDPVRRLVRDVMQADVERKIRTA